MDVEQLIANAQTEAEQRPTPQGGHPSEAQLWGYLHGDLAGAMQRRIGAHLGSCPACRAELASLRGAFAELEVLLPPHLSASALEPAPERPSDRSDRRGRRVMRLLQPLFGPHRWAWHAAAFAVGGSALIGLNSYLQAAFAPEPSPFGSPPPAPWWTTSWAPYVVGGWAAVLALHGLVVRRRRRRDGRTPDSPRRR